MTRYGMLSRRRLHKWGTAGNLPADHPYQNAAPGVDRVEVNISWDLVTGDQIFARLRVEITP